MSNQMKMSTRNLVWLIAIVVIGVTATLAFSWKIGLAAAGVTLLVSEIVERQARAKRTAPTSTPVDATADV